MNITELARQVKIPTPKLREIIPQLGFDVGLKAIQVDDRTAHKIIEQLNNSKVRDKFLTVNETLTTSSRPSDTPLQTSDSKDSLDTENKGTLKVGDRIVVKELAKQMDMPVTKLILELMRNGVMASLNQDIDYETAAIIAEDLGFQVEKIEANQVDLQEEQEKRAKFLAEKDSQKLQPRPPVVTVMGHVDHGKTKLLDAIRETNIVDGEAGGITQHIGAYQVEKKNQSITFIDTPGHEAFSAMRSRGAQVADIVILVVAADDGVQPQTIESISHIQSANLPFIVAINKVDKTEANVDKIKSELAELKLTPEDWGGKTICVEISAKKKINIDGLLETLLLVYEMEKEKIQANPDRPAVGTIIESHLDKGEGSVATVLVQTGTLHPCDVVKIGDAVGKIKVMKDWTGKTVMEATPSMPVKIVGLKSVPKVGEILQVMENTKSFKKEVRKNKSHKSVSVSKNKVSVVSQNTECNDDDDEVQKISIILKSDVLGSEEAILESLDPLQQPDLILNVVRCGLGNITEVDIERAIKQNALIIGFNVKPSTQAEQIARDKDVKIKTSKIIYELLDFLKDEMNKMLSAKIKQTIIGRLQILKIFRTEKDSQIIGAKVLEGKIIADVKLKIYRQNQPIGQALLAELQSAKQIVTEVPAGQEAGLKIQGFSEAQAGDIIEAVKEEKIERKI